MTSNSTAPPMTSAGTARRSRWLGWGLLVAGAFVLLALAAVTARDVLDHGRSLRMHMDALEQVAQGGRTSLNAAGVARAEEHLSAMRRDLGAIKARVGPLLPAGRMLAWVPQYGGDLAAAADLLQIAAGTATAGDHLVHGMAPALELVSAPDSTDAGLEIGRDLLPVLAAARIDLEAAQRELADVALARARVDVHSLSPRVAGLMAQLDRYLPLLATGVDAALLAPQLLGAEGPRTYLVVAQNNHELRPTGGFISGVGELTVDAGRLASLVFVDSYAVDNFEVPHKVPPLAFRQVLLGDLWLFRDTNWNADFSTSATRAVEVYAGDRGVRADGLVALDLSALESLLSAIGPVHVEGIADPVTAKNVVQVLQTQWADPTAGPGYEGTWNPEWWAHRKDFMGEVADAALDKLMSGQNVDLTALATALMQVLNEKHLMIYLADPAAARLLQEKGWSGTLPAPHGLSDLLAVVDTNVGFNKVDPNVARSIRYQVNLTTAGRPRATLTLAYQNHSTRAVDVCVQEARYGEAYADMMDRCYWDYVRVYVPLGSELLSAPALDLPAGSLLARSGMALSASPISSAVWEGQWPAWAAFFDLAPGAERAMTFEYELPVTVLHSDAVGQIRYRLRVHKQPGTDATPLELEVRLPPGAVLIDTVPADLFTRQGPFVSAATDLRTDREFEIVFRKDENKP